MQFEEFSEAVRQAKATISTADTFIQKMAGMVKGKLQSSRVYSSTLDELKRELRDYDIRTGQWR